MKQFAVLVLSSFLVLTAHSQAIKGKLLDLNDNKPLSGATLFLSSKHDSTNIRNAITDSAGYFQFAGLPVDSFTFRVSFIGYSEYKQVIAINDSVPVIDLGTLFIPKASKELSGVTVVSKTPPAQQKGDTLELNANAFKVNPDATTEDLIKKMPGITVDKDGTVTAQGETVRKVTIDGKDFFGDDATTALRNLPSEIVDKIQVFDKLSDQAQLTGFDDGNSQRALNIVTKSGINNGQFGRIYAGAGTDDRYSAGGNVSFFKGKRRISLIGLFNNINQQNFSNQDLLGVTSSGNNRGGGGGGGRGGPGRGGNQNNFQIGPASGIATTNAAGLNFSDSWGKKVDVAASYFYNNSNTVNDQILRSQTFYGDKTLFSDQTSASKANNYNNRINLRLEYRIDSSNTIIVTPSLNFQRNATTSSSTSTSYYGFGDTVNTSNNLSSAMRSGYNLRNNILYRHGFAKRGRSISLNLNTALNKNDGQSYAYSQYQFFESGVPSDSLQNQLANNNSNGYTLSTNVAYTEPIGKHGQLQINYSPSYTKNKADQETFLYDDMGGKYSDFNSLLSNKFDNTTITQNGGVSYRLNPNRDNQFSLGANLQYSKLESDRTFPNVNSFNHNFTNVLPNLMWRKKFSTFSSFNIFYRASTNFPSVTQLQDVVNLSNPLRVSAGNPDLKQSYTHVISGRYTFTDTKTSKGFLANIFLQTASDYISNATFRADADTIIQQGIQLKAGSQLSKPVNLNGYGSLRSLLSYYTPISFIKSIITFSTGLNYSRLPGLSNGIKSITNNSAYNGGIGIASNVSEYIDFYVSYNAIFNNAKNALQPELSTHYVYQSAGVKLNLLSKNGWFIQNDVTNQSTSGLSAGFNQSFWLWNAGFGKKFLAKKAGELKLTVFDLLKQNQSITRSVSENYIEDSQSRVLQQYFMLTFTYSLRNFGKAAAPQRRFEGRPEGGRPGGPMNF